MVAQRLGIVMSHPVQYVTPWLRHLARVFDLTVFYVVQPTEEQQGGEFGVRFTWDVDLLDGYRSVFLRNVARRPDIDHFSGCDTPEIRERIRRQNFDAVVVFGWYLKTYWQAIRACRRESIPVFIRGDSTLLNSSRSRVKNWVKTSIGPRLLNRVTGHLYPGQRNREYLEHFGARPERLFFVPHFVDNQFFRSRAEAARGGAALRLREQLGIAPDAFVATFVGKLIPRKRPLDLTAAVKQLHASGENVTALFAGDGPLRADVERECESLGAGARCCGFRNQSELPAVYAASDVFVLPSTIESWGLVVNEAMAAGVGAVVSDHAGCAPDLVRDGKTGFVFRCGDTGDLAARIREYRRLYDRSRDQIREHLQQTMTIYSIERATSGLVDALAAVAAEGCGEA